MDWTIVNIPKKTIKAKIDALKLKSNKYEKWTEEEDKIFKEAWETYTMEELLKTFPNRTYQKMMLHAGYLGYKSLIHRNKKNDMSFLDLENLTPESAYWWGFIMADGHISKKQLVVQLKNVDFLHLKKLSEHLKCNIKEKNDFCRIAVEDKNRITKWRETLKMQETAKTYFPPKLLCFEELFIYFFIGFVDGDGCIWLCKNYPLLKIELHNSWKENLDYFSKILKEKYCIKSVKTKISKKGTSVLSIENRNDIIEISKFCNKVDYMNRKWDKILEYNQTIKKV